MIDIVRFSVDMKNSWVKQLGFHEFLHYKNLHIILGWNEEKCLQILKRGKIDLLLCMETPGGKDPLHWRKSGLNHLLLTLARQHDTAVGFCLSNILEQKGVKRSQLLGRMMQNVRWCRTYKVRMVLCTFAQDIFGLRSASDLESFGRVIGMTPAEAKKALQFQKRKKDIQIHS